MQATGRIACNVPGKQFSRTTASSICLGRSVSAKCPGMDAFGFQGRQGLDRFPGFLLGQAKLVDLLEVKPKFPSGAEEMSQTQSRVAGYGAFTVKDFGDAVRGRRFPRNLGRHPVEEGLRAIATPRPCGHRVSFRPYLKGGGGSNDTSLPGANPTTLRRLPPQREILAYARLVDHHRRPRLRPLP